MDIATIIAAVIAAVAAIYSVRVTKKGNEKNIESTEKISKQVQNAENERTKAQIDANLVWNARIEWIQNVRRVTADFITACYIYMQTDKNDVKQQYENQILVHKNKALLILYFGPDTSKEKGATASDICDQKTNAGKNKMIVDLINQIYEQIKKYFINIKSSDLAQNSLNQCNDCKNNEEPLCPTDNCATRQNVLYRDKLHADADIYELQGNIALLSEAMRIYLKLEWNKAKHWNL